MGSQTNETSASRHREPRKLFKATDFDLASIASVGAAGVALVESEGGKDERLSGATSGRDWDSEADVSAGVDDAVDGGAGQGSAPVR